VPVPYNNEHRAAVRAMLEARRQGEKFIVPEVIAVDPVADIMDALKQSLTAAKVKADAAPEKTAAEKLRRRRAKRDSASKSCS
jgi:non-homologous end joining protein Ku